MPFNFDIHKSWKECSYLFLFLLRKFFLVKCCNRATNSWDESYLLWQLWYQMERHDFPCLWFSRLQRTQTFVIVIEYFLVQIKLICEVNSEFKLCVWASSHFKIWSGAGRNVTGKGSEKWKCKNETCDSWLQMTARHLFLIIEIC